MLGHWVGALRATVENSTSFWITLNISKTVSFTFFADLIDDISDLAKDRDSQMKCILHMETFSLPLSEFL
jgi:hypothetical protein